MWFSTSSAPINCNANLSHKILELFHTERLKPFLIYVSLYFKWLGIHKFLFTCRNYFFLFEYISQNASLEIWYGPKIFSFLRKGRTLIFSEISVITIEISWHFVTTCKDSGVRKFCETWNKQNQLEVVKFSLLQIFLNSTLRTNNVRLSFIVVDVCFCFLSFCAIFL